MNKLASLSFTLCFCLMFVGVLALAGCGEEPTVSSISVSQNPDVVVYKVGQTLDTTGGKFQVNYSDGSTRTYDLAFAVADEIRFDSVGTKTITISYEGKTTGFEVRVEKGDFDTSLYEGAITRIFNGEPQDVSLFSNVTLPAGISANVPEYKVAGANDDTYSTTAPTDAGRYTVKVHLNGGENYNDKDLIIDFEIKKADYSSLANGDFFNYKGINSVTYGDDFDLSLGWEVESNVLGAIPLDSEYAQSISYYYIKTSDATSTNDTFSTETEIVADGEGKVYANLDAGSYTIIVRGASTNNLNAFEMSATFNVYKKALELGTDYNVKITVTNADDESTREVTFIESTTGVIPTVITLADGESVSVEIEFLGDVADDCTVNNLYYHYSVNSNSTPSVAYSVAGNGIYQIVLELDSTNYSYPTTIYDAFRVE